MPGELPDSSAYTYAVEFSVDEAVEAGATDVKFTKPVTTYVDNFLGFKAGTIVPSAYYDEGKGAWVPSKNGLVIKIVSEANGRANVDTDGDGTADNAGLDDAERHEARPAVRRRQVAVARRGRALHALGLQLALRLPRAVRRPRRGAAPAAVLPRVPGRRLDHRRLQPDARREAVRPRHARSTSTTARPACPATRRPTGSRSR